MDLRKGNLSLPYLIVEKTSLKIKRQLLRMYSTVLPNVDLKIIFKPVSKLQCLSKLKSGIPLLSRSKVVYKISCNNCNEFYVGLTTRKLEERISEHIKKKMMLVLYINMLLKLVMTHCILQTRDSDFR